MESLKRDKVDLTNKLNYKNQEVERLSAELSTLKGQVRNLQQNSYMYMDITLSEVLILPLCWGGIYNMYIHVEWHH